MSESKAESKVNDVSPEAPNGDVQPYTTVAAELGLEDVPPLTQGDARNGLTKVFGLQEVANSDVPSGPGKTTHVFGPGQNVVDPVAAGLDTRLVGVAPPARTVMTQTGEVGSGNRPFTYVEHTGPEMLKQSAPADGKHVTVQQPQLKADPKPVAPAQSKVAPEPLPVPPAGQAPAPQAAAAKPAS